MDEEAKQYEDFKARLGKLMLDRGINRAGLASRIGRSKNTIDNIWKADRKTFPYANDLYLMAQALGVSMEFLTTGYDDKTRLSDGDLRDIVKELELLKEYDPIQLRNVSEQIHALMLFKMKSAKDEKENYKNKGGQREAANA